MQKIHSITEEWNQIHELITETCQCVSDVCLYWNEPLCKLHFSRRNSFSQQTIKLKQGDLGLLFFIFLLFLFWLSNFSRLQQGFHQGGIGCSGLLWLKEGCLFLCVCGGEGVYMCVCECVCASGALEHIVLYGCALYFLAHHSWSNHHNICHSKANITLTTSRLRAISSRMQCCCHSWFSFL